MVSCVFLVRIKTTKGFALKTSVALFMATETEFVKFQHAYICVHHDFMGSANVLCSAINRTNARKEKNSEFFI